MIRRNTWIILVILAGLIGFSFYWSAQKAKQAAEATPTAGPTNLFDSSEGSPNDIKIEDSTGKSVEIARDANGTWVLKAPTESPAEQASAEAAATQLSALHVIGDVQLGPDVVGLDKPDYTITVTFSGGKTHKLTVGSVTPIQTGYYVQLDGGKTQIVDKQGLDALLGLLTNPPYPPTPTPAASSTPPPEPATPTPETTLTLPTASVTESATASP